jgi:hypothetical protein
LTRDLYWRIRFRSYHKINFQLQFYVYVTYCPEDDQLLVETCSHVIYVDKNQLTVVLMVLYSFETAMWLRDIKNIFTVQTVIELYRKIRHPSVRYTF